MLAIEAPTIVPMPGNKRIESESNGLPGGIARIANPDRAPKIQERHTLRIERLFMPREYAHSITMVYTTD